MPSPFPPPYFLPLGPSVGHLPAPGREELAPRHGCTDGRDRLLPAGYGALADGGGPLLPILAVRGGSGCLPGAPQLHPVAPLPPSGRHVSVVSLMPSSSAPEIALAGTLQSSISRQPAAVGSQSAAASSTDALAATQPPSPPCQPLILWLLPLMGRQKKTVPCIRASPRSLLPALRMILHRHWLLCLLHQRPCPPPLWLSAMRTSLLNPASPLLVRTLPAPRFQRPRPPLLSSPRSVLLLCLPSSLEIALGRLMVLVEALGRPPFGLPTQAAPQLAAVPLAVRCWLLPRTPFPLLSPPLFRRW